MQSSPSAWSIVGTLISHPDSSVRFFGASTLQQAIARSWHSLDPNDPAPRTLTGPVSSLKESLLHWLATSAVAAYPAPHASASGTGTSGEKPVLRKLAAATTSLSLRIGGEWNDWLLEVIMRIAASGAAREASLEVLSTAIEEIARADFVGSQRYVSSSAWLAFILGPGPRVLRLTNNRLLTHRMSYMSSLSSTIPHLVSTLSSSMSPTAQPSEINLALSCFVAYLNAGQLSHTELTTLYPCLLPHVSRSETVVAAASALEELIERASGLSEMGGGSGVTRFVNRQRTTELVRGWVDGPYVRQVTEQAIAEARDGADPDDEAVAIFKLVSTLGDHLILNFLFDPPPPASAAQIDPSNVLTLAHPSVHALLSLLLALSTFPGYSSEAYAINELPTGCWMYLQELGAEDGFMPGPGDGREGRPGREAEWTVYRGVFAALADGLRSRATRPREDEFFGWPKGEFFHTRLVSVGGRSSRKLNGHLNADVRDAFRMQRSTTVADTFQYAYFVLRDDLIAQLVQLAAEQVAAPSTGGKDAYEDLEATLFMLLLLGEVVPMASTLSEMDATATPSPLQQYLATLFGPAVLGRLPTEAGMHPSLRLTALRLVGEYSSWFASHPDACLQAVTFVIGGLQEPELVPGAAKALRGLCDANRKVLMRHVPSFVQVLGGLEGRIADAELAKVLQSVASVVQALPENEIVEPLLVRLTTTGHRRSCDPDRLLVPYRRSPLPSSTSLQPRRAGRSKYARTCISWRQAGEKCRKLIALHSQNQELARDNCLQQLSYLSGLTRGLADPDADVIDLDASLDETSFVRESAQRILSDPRIVDLRQRIAAGIEGVAQTWPGDAEIVSALSDYIRQSTSDAVPSPVALDSLALLNLCANALKLAPSSVWLGAAAQLLARMARDLSDASISDAELASLMTPVETVLNVILTAYPDVHSTCLSFHPFFR